jgi:hypothetical protein
MKNSNFTVRFFLLLSLAFTLTKTVAQQPVSTLPSNIVYVDAVGDFPREQLGVITLNPFKVYIISGMVDIGQSYIIMNGAGLRGLDPTKDRIISATKGAVLRSQDTDVYLEKICVVPLGPTTTAYDFEDNTGTKTLNLLAGNSVIEAPRVSSAGVGRISGFNSCYVTSNFWRCRDGLKLYGSTGKFCGAFNYITGISAGAGIEFMAGFESSDIDLSNNYFVFSGNVGVIFSPKAKTDQGRMTGNLFRGPATLLSGFNSFTPGWEMRQNGAGIPDTKPYGYVFMNENQMPTKLITPQLFTKIAGNTTTIKGDGFTAESNKFTYTGKRPLSARIYVNAGGKIPEANSDYSIAIFKNGLIQVAPNSSINVSAKNEGYQLILETEVDVVQGDFLEVFIKNNVNSTPIIVKDLQFRVSE